MARLTWHEWKQRWTHTYVRMSAGLSVDQPVAIPISVGVAVFGGLAVASSAYTAVGVGAAASVAVVLASRPPRLNTGLRLDARQAAAASLVLLYAIPMLTLGREFSVIGYEPFYLAEALLAVAALLMLPALRLDAVRPAPLLGACLAALSLYAVYVGMQKGHPAATKGLVLVFYPLLAIIVAAWIAALRSPSLVLARVTRWVLPLVAPGLLVVLVAGGTVIPAAYGLYLGVVAAFAVTPRLPSRRLLAISSLLGLALLVVFTAKRGPVLTVCFAAFAAWLAVGTRRPLVTTVGAIAAVLCAVAAITLASSSQLVDPTRFPVVGSLIDRAVATSEPESTAANNVHLRTQMWSYALSRTFSEAPLTGLGAFHPVDVTFSGSRQADDSASGVHNSFIGYGFYAGFPAALLLVVLFGTALLRSWRLRESSPYAPAMFGAMVAVVSTASTNVALETPYIAGPSWLVFAASLGLAGWHRAKKSGAGSPTTTEAPTTVH